MVTRVLFTATGHSGPDFAMRRDLGAASRAIAETAPVLRYLLQHHANPLLSDVVVARVQGLLTDLARQLADTIPASAWPDEPSRTAFGDDLCNALADTPALLCHAHALALEWQLVENMEVRLGLDIALPPLLQARVGSPDAVISGTASVLLAAQARFAQAMRRMELPLMELPADLFRICLNTMRALGEDREGTAAYATAAESALRERYDERRTRLGLIERVIIKLDAEAVQALSLEHAGVAIFLTAVAIGSGQDRSGATFAVVDPDVLRFALSLTACGLNSGEVAAQLLAVHPQASIPHGLDLIAPDHALDLLAASNAAEVRT